MSPLDEHAPDALVRTAFCSEANFSSWADPRGVELEISRLMYPSPRTESDQAVGGIFHYGNRRFLQCLEGPCRHVRALVERNRNDARHRNQKILAIRPIEERMFRPNTMSYVSMRGQLIELLKANGVDGFDPYRMDRGMIDEFLALWLERQKQRRVAVAS